MDRFLGLDNIMSSLGLKESKTFEAWWNEFLQYRENQKLDIDGFAWADPQIDFTYEMLEAYGKVEPMAVYVDLNSEPLPAGKNTELKKLTGSIPRQKYRIVRGENDYRKELITLNNVRAVAAFRNTSTTEAISNYLTKYLFTTLSDIPDSHKNSLNYQVGQMKSRGKLSITDKNNPRGIHSVSFEANVPAANINMEKWITRKTDGTYEYVTTVDPIATLKKKIREIKWYKYGAVKLEIDEAFFFVLVEHPAILKKIGYLLRPELMVSPNNDTNATEVGRSVVMGNDDNAVKSAFQRLLGVDEIKFHNTVVGVEQFNSTSGKFERPILRTFDEGVILLRPVGNIGTIFNVMPLRPDGRAIVADIFGGRGIVEYRYDERTKTQDWCSELTVLAVPNRPKDMYYFDCMTVATQAGNAGSGGGEEQQTSLDAQPASLQSTAKSTKASV